MFRFVCAVSVCICNIGMLPRVAHADYPPNEINSPGNGEELESGETIVASGTASESPISGWGANFKVRFQFFDPQDNIVADHIVDANVFEYLWQVSCPVTIPNAAMGGTWFVTLVDHYDSDNDNEPDSYWVLDSATGPIDD